MVFYPFQNWFNFKIGQNVAHLTHDDKMGLAFQLAAQGLGTTNPNPSVGALIVNQNRIVGWGITQAAGGNHAEIEALTMAGELAVGGEIYVTLEPCSHYGKTPPCSLALKNSGIQKVFVSVVDSNPQVSGRGISHLQDHGVEVCHGVLDSWGRDFYESFFHWIKTGLPYVVVKTAHSMTGAMNEGEMSFQKGVRITSEETNKLMHQGRRASQVLVVGGNTLRIDRPKLDLRNYQLGPLEQPKNPDIIISTREITQEMQDIVDEFQGRASLSINKFEEKSILSLEMLRKLGERGVHQVWVEPGQNSCLSLWQSKYWDKWVFLRSLTVKIQKNSPWGMESWYPNPHSQVEICKFGHTKHDQFLIVGKKPCSQV